MTRNEEELENGVEITVIIKSRVGVEIYTIGASTPKLHFFEARSWIFF